MVRYDLLPHIIFSIIISNVFNANCVSILVGSQITEKVSDNRRSVGARWWPQSRKIQNALARLPMLSAGRDRDQIILDHYLKGGEFSCTVAKRFPFYFFIPSDCYRYGANKDVVPMILPNRHPAPKIATHFLILLHFYSRTADFAFRVHSGKPQSPIFMKSLCRGWK